MKNKAFTLIELLVVVLIIGILAAIALPKYEKAVEKSRAAEAVQILRYMHNQVEMTYLAEGNRNRDVGPNADFGIELGGGFLCAAGESFCGSIERCCNEHWCYDNNSVEGAWNGYACQPESPVAYRVLSKPTDVWSISPKYKLMFDGQRDSSHYGQVLCKDVSGSYCFMGDRNPIN